LYQYLLYRESWNCSIPVKAGAVAIIAAIAPTITRVELLR